VEGDALDYPGDFLGRGPAFRDGGIHLVGDSFSHGRSALRITEIVLVGRGVAAFLSKQTVTSITFVTAKHDIALIA
jgi:hypothetical protein